MLSDLKRKFLKNVRGPVFPIPTPFTQDGMVDYAGIEKYVDFVLRKGAQTIMVTVGTAQFDVLTVEEMKKVNEAVAETAKGRALTIVTTPTKGPTLQAIDFARHAEAVGADGILVVYPDRYYSDDGVYEFFKDIASSCSVGVLIHLMPIRAGRAGLGPEVHYSPALVGRIAAIDNMVGMKEESHDQSLAYKYNRLLQGKFLIIGGAGGMRSYLSAYQWGQPAYLVGIGNLVPEIEFDFYSAITQGNYEKARCIVFEKEEPFFEAAVKVGWHLALKVAMENLGLMAAWERRPVKRLELEEQNAILNNIPAY